MIVLTEFKKAFYISFFYVGLGTLSILSLDPSFFLYGPWAFWGYVITLPVSIFSFGVAYSGNGASTTILIIQSIVFLIFWFLLYRYFLKGLNVRKNKSRK
jgi:hypothetical protein